MLSVTHNSHYAISSHTTFRLFRLFLTSTLYNKVSIFKKKHPVFKKTHFFSFNPKNFERKFIIRYDERKKHETQNIKIILNKYKKERMLA